MLFKIDVEDLQPFVRNALLPSARPGCEKEGGWPAEGARNVDFYSTALISTDSPGIRFKVDLGYSLSDCSAGGRSDGSGDRPGSPETFVTTFNL